MTDSTGTLPQTLRGGCMCGSVRYTISQPPVAMGLCHCDRCRPQSGSAFSTVIFISPSALTIEGQTAVFDDIGGSGMYVARRYCPRCGSPLTTESQALSDLMFVKAGTLDENSWFKPTMEMFVTKRRPWVTPLADAIQYAENPPV